MATNVPMSPGTTRGRIEQVPCPWCGKHNNLSEIAAMTADGFSQHGHGSLPGAKVDCDHCGRCYVIVQVQKVTFLTVRQAAGQRETEQGQPQQQQAQAPAAPNFIQRLLGLPGGRR